MSRSDRSVRISFDERGVSEVVSFVLAFALITTTAGVVYVTGIGGLQNVRDAEQLQNAERAFDVLDDNLLDHHLSGAPNRATEIKLNDAVLRQDEDVVATVEITNLATSVNASVRLSPIIYSPSNSPRAVLYSNGAVIRSQNDGAVIKSGPPITVHEDGSSRAVVLPLLQTRAGAVRSIGGTSAVLVRTKLVLGETLINRTDADADGGTDPDADPAKEYEVEYTINTTEVRAEAWERHLDDEFSWMDDACTIPDSAPDSVKCSFHVERLYVTATRVDTGFSR